MSALKTILILGITVGAAILIYRYIKDEEEPTTECVTGEPVKCADGYYWECVNDEWVKTSTPCGINQICYPGDEKCNYATGLREVCSSDGMAWFPTDDPCIKCPICVDDDCELTFPSQSALDEHYEECHIAAPSNYVRVSPTYKSDTTKGCQQLDYDFCRPRLLNMVTGTVFGNCADRPLTCDPYIEVWYQKLDGTWVALGSVRIPDDAPSSSEYAFTPSVWATALRYRGRADGLLCGSWDPKIEWVSMAGYFADIDRTPLPAPCAGESVGWKVTEW